MRALKVAMAAVTYLVFFYVDTTNLALEELEPGSWLVDIVFVVVVNEELECNKTIPGDYGTTANSICKTILMTIECPSNY